MARAAAASKTTPEVDEQLVDDGYTTMPRPGRWVELEPGKTAWEEGAHPCQEGCGGGHPVHRAATHVSCEHGAWRFTEPTSAPVVAEQPSAEDLRARAAELLAQADALDSTEPAK